MKDPGPLYCEVGMPAGAVPNAYRSALRLIAGQLGLQLVIAPGPPPRSGADVVGITVYLPASLAGSQHPAWCLACRAACLLPGARVGVLVAGADFGPLSQLETRRSA
jgi:hypothetical protein